MKTQAFVVADDPVYANWLQTAVSGVDFSLIRPLDAEDLLSRLEMSGRPDLLFIQFHPDNADERGTLIERVVDRMPELPVVGIGIDHDPVLVLAAMRAGARDFFVLRRDEVNVGALIAKLLRRSSTAAAPSTRGKQALLVGALSAHPYEGIAFLGEHLALALQERMANKERVLLIDMATPAGAAAIFLNLSPTYGLLDAVNDVHRCDATLVDTAFPRHKSGLYVLSLPEDLIGRPRLDADAVLRLIGVLRGLFACIVVTLDGHAPMEVIRGVVTQAERSLLVTDQSILKSRHNKYLLRTLRLDDCPLDRMRLVVDNYRHRLGLEPESLAELFDLPLQSTLSNQGVTRIQAMNSGDSLFDTAPKDTYAVEVRRLATLLTGGDTAAEFEAPKGLLGRLFG